MKPLTLLLCALSALCGVSAAADKPNVLIVLVDDAGTGDFGCHGHPFLKTPHIDRLHGESLRLTDFHVAPMCSPTRGQLLTGSHGLRNGVTSVTAGRTFLRSEYPTMPQIFAAAGYRTGIFGKWHLGDSHPHRPMDKGFEVAVWTRGWGFTSAPEFSNTLLDGKILRGTREENFPGYITDFCFDEAMKFMRAQQAEKKAFLCFLPLHAAHAPHVVPEKFSAPYADKAAPNFFGMLANVDENMGRLDAFLRDTGLRDDTIVVFFTDNGGTAGVKTFNAGLRAGKVTYYDGGHRVPCFVRWPAGGLRAAADLDALTHVQDLLPTLLDFCGVKKTAGPDFDGISLAPLLRGKTNTLPERTLFVQFGPGFGQQDNSGPKKFQSAVMRGNWRLVHGTELYNIAADRAQERDVAGQHPKIIAQLRADYEAWWAQVAPRLDDFVPVNIGAPQEPDIVLTSADWQDAYADNSNHIRNAAGGPRGGPWNVNVVRSGEYKVTLARWPFESATALDAALDAKAKALPIAVARLTAAGLDLAERPAPGAKSVTFTAKLPAGRTQFHAWFQDAAGKDLCGAYYARVTAVFAAEDAGKRRE